MTLRCLLPILAAAALPGAVQSSPAHPQTPVVQPGAGSRTDIGQDLVILDNKQSIGGTVIPHAADAVFVDINTGSGRMRIRRERVVSVVLGLASQRDRIDPKDLASLTAYARWCISHRQFPEALAALDQAVALPDCDVETRGLHATLVDEAPNRGPAQALPLYRRYKSEGGTDATIIARLQQLEDVLSAHNDELKKLNLPPVELSAVAPPVVTQAPLSPSAGTGTGSAAPGKEGLEAKGWQAEDIQWSLPTDAKLVTLPPEEGGQCVLSVVSPGKPTAPPAAGARVPDKVAI